MKKVISTKGTTITVKMEVDGDRVKKRVTVRGGTPRTKRVGRQIGNLLGFVVAQAVKKTGARR